MVTFKTKKHTFGLEVKCWAPWRFVGMFPCKLPGYLWSGKAGGVLEYRSGNNLWPPVARYLKWLDCWLERRLEYVLNKPSKYGKAQTYLVSVKSNDIWNLLWLGKVVQNKNFLQTKTFNSLNNRFPSVTWRWSHEIHKAIIAYSNSYRDQIVQIMGRLRFIQ